MMKEPIGSVVRWMLVGWIVGGLAGWCQADEPAQKFLEALRDAGYYDTAADYLDSIKNSDLVSPKFRKTIPFEKAETLIARVSTMRDINKADQVLDEAQQLLSQFAGSGQKPDVLGRVYQQQGNLYNTRSKIRRLQAQSDRLVQKEKDALHQEEREMLKKALASYRESLKQIRKLLAKGSPDRIQLDPEDPSTAKKLKYFQNQYTLVRVKIPTVLERLAETVPPGSQESKELYAKAAADYVKVLDSYRGYYAGYQASLGAGRCYQILGKHKKALFELEDVLNLGNTSWEKRLKAEGFLAAIKSWNQAKDYPYEEIISRIEPAVAVLVRQEQRKPEWLRTSIELAKAYHAKANVLKKKKDRKSKSEAKALDKKASILLKSVARVRSEHRDLAKKLLEEWKINFSGADPDLPPPATVDEAITRAKDAISGIQDLLPSSNELKKKVKTLAGEPKKAAEEELQGIQAEIEEQARQALELLSTAWGMVDDKTDRPTRNRIRINQSYCYFVTGRYLESALISQFLLDRYPKVEGTSQAMPILINSYVKMLEQANEGDKAFEKSRLLNACVAVVERWPGESASALAATQLTQMAIEDHDLEMAAKYVVKVSKDSPARSALESLLGERLWFDYVKKKKAGEVPAETLAKQLEEAIGHLRQGVMLTRPDQIDYLAARSALWLTDALLASGDVEGALKQLEGGRISPLDLVKQKHPAVANPAVSGFYNRAAYRIAIKTYLAAMRKQDGQQKKWIEKATGVLDAMRADMATRNDTKDQQNITRIYHIIGKELIEQFYALKSGAKKKAFASTLASFLGTIEKDSNDSKTVLWAGTTLLSAAEALKQANLDEDAKKIFGQAVSALDRAQELGFQGDPQEEQWNMKLKQQRALALRGEGKFDAAIDQLVAILKTNTARLSVQMDAAQTLLMQGKTTRKPIYFVKALSGDRKGPDPKHPQRQVNLIWGWKKLAMATRNNPKLLDQHYEAVYRSAECRIEYGRVKKNKKAFESAYKEIGNAINNDPELGGGIWKEKLLKLRAEAKRLME